MPPRTPLLCTHRALSSPASSPSFLIRHSSSSSAPSFVPFSRTSADTEIPYGEPTQASSAYLPQHPSTQPSTSTFTSTSTSTSTPDPAATTSTPSTLTDRQRHVLEQILRVDQAGELGANWIYKGQHAVLKRKRDGRVANLVQDMWDGEKKHIATFDKLITQHGVRPTALYPVWKAAGFALGAGTALLGNRAAMACTEAVETVIGEHYNSYVHRFLNGSLEVGPTSTNRVDVKPFRQLKELHLAFPNDHASIPLLKQLLLEFRDDELGHLDTAVENESQQAPAYALLSAAIATGCRLAIGISGKV
ncbi:BQ5605_C004g03078 [Microbotryum silenes-dioicae]|uniref:5-demethoxyubiquinone hydroxylase, mitochondrial n=1 Tax=Microbotryum silenes-dioicae TaxID=796604 RepID=A0A2X0ME86_9BASI|nr:BQ5605_C004g03078 [Microbotryum silenes-dioicae]